MDLLMSAVLWINGLTFWTLHTSVVKAGQWQVCRECTHLHTHTHTGTQKMLTGNDIVIYWQDRILLKEPWPPENQYDSQIDLGGRDLIWFIDILTLRNYLFVQCYQNSISVYIYVEMTKTYCLFESYKYFLIFSVSVFKYLLLIKWKSCE